VDAATFPGDGKELTAYSDLLTSTPINTRKTLRTTVIWARDGVAEDRRDPGPDWDKGTPMPNSMEWLWNNRTDLGDNGRQKLLGEGKVRCFSMEGNHFTIMEESMVSRQVYAALVGFANSESPPGQRSWLIDKRGLEMDLTG
jgi:hypothetical protein